MRIFERLRLLNAPFVRKKEPKRTLTLKAHFTEKDMVMRGQPQVDQGKSNAVPNRPK